jgi:hypothetical protein
MNAERFLEMLEAVRPAGDHQWLGRCPAHDDRRPSLSVGTGDDGRVLLTCYAGCSPDEIVAALNLNLSDLFEENDQRARGVAAPARPTPKKKTKASRPREDLPTDATLAEYRNALLDNPAAVEKARLTRGWSEAALKKLEVGAHGGRLYFPVRAADGELINLVKYAVSPKEGESKSLALRGRPRGLFPAPETIDGPEIWLVEGEPDALSASTLGLPGVAIPGVKGWRDEYVERLAGRKVVVCMDSDKPGREVAQKISTALTQAEVEHRVLDLAPERSDGFDLGEFLNSAGSVGEARMSLLGMAGKVVVTKPQPPPDTRGLLGDIEGAIRTFVVLSPQQLTVVALWVLHTHAVEAADTTPYLAITSPEKRCGKTRLLELLQELVARPLQTANASVAAVFRALGGQDGEPPATVLWDEIDNVFKGRGEDDAAMQGILNAGYRRGGHALRCQGEGSNQVSVQWPVFGPKAFAGIGDLPETLADRSIRIRLQRITAAQKVARGRFREIKAATEPIRERASRWSEYATPILSEADPAIPENLNARAADCAEPLLAISDLAGEEWPELGREAVLSIYRDTPEQDNASWGIQLLGDIRSIFARRDADRLHTDGLIAALRADDEAPWAGWGKEGLNARALGKLLSPYGIRSRSIRLSSGETPKGYKKEQFEDAWSRYLPRIGSLSATTATTALQSQKTAPFYPPQESFVADNEQASNPHSRAVVADVAAGNANPGENGLFAVTDEGVR